MKNKTDVLTYTETKTVETKITSINLGQAIDLATSITIQLRTHGVFATCEEFSMTKKAALDGFTKDSYFETNDGTQTCGDLTTISGVIHRNIFSKKDNHGHVDFIHPITNVSVAKLFVTEDDRYLVIDGNG